MKGVRYVPSVSRTLRDQPPRDVAIRRLAEGQHGVVSLPQLQSCGLSPSAVRERVTAGRLTHVHRGVYTVGHGRLTKRRHWMAAVLAYRASRDGPWSASHGGTSSETPRR